MQIGDKVQIYNEFTSVGFDTEIKDIKTEHGVILYFVNSRVGDIWVAANRVRKI